MSNIKNDVKQFIYRIIVIILTLILITIFFFKYSGDSTPIKSALSLIGNYVGGITTLAAAYIALFLYSDWRNAEKFNAAKDALISLTKLKSHIDTNYMRAKFHIDSYFLKDQQYPPSNNYIAERLFDAQNSKAEKEKYKAELQILLADFFEKADIYEVLFNDILVKSEDREFNFCSYMFFISGMYTQSYTANLENLETITTTRNLADHIKNQFERNYLNEMIEKLKKNITI